MGFRSAFGLALRSAKNDYFGGFACVKKEEIHLENSVDGKVKNYGCNFHSFCLNSTPIVLERGAL